MNEPCRLCWSEPTLATYYDFYRFHCPTPGCREHLGDGTIYSGKGEWYGSIDDARDAWNHRQSYGETARDVPAVKPEQVPGEAESEPQIGSERKTKKRLRAEAVERLKVSEPIGCFNVIRDAFGWSYESSHTDVEWRDALIDLLTDDDCGTAEAETSQVPELDADETGDRTCPNGDGTPSNDTREQLEADIAASSYSFVHTPAGFRDIKSWLDRQDAITRREVLCQPDERDEQIAELTAERDELEVEIAEYEHDYGQLLDEKYRLKAERNELWQQVNSLTAERDEAYKRGYDNGLHANTKAAFSAAKQAFGDESANRFEGGIIKSQAQRIRELEAELEAQRKRANDAERGVLREDWYVSRDRYEDDVAELQAERDKLQNRFLAALDAADAIAEEANDGRREIYDIKKERDRLKDVVQKQADSFAKLERELHEAKVEAMRNRDGVDALKEKCQAQREELARFNAEKRGTRQLPKKVVWPRDGKGKPVKLNALGAKNILFDSRGYLVEYRDGTTRYETYKQAKEAADEA